MPGAVTPTDYCFHRHSEPHSLAFKSVISLILQDAKVSHRRADLIAEAVSRLLLAAALSSTGSGMEEKVFGDELLTQSTELLSIWLRRNEAEVIDTASDAASALLPMLSSTQQLTLQNTWIDIISEIQSGGRSGQDRGILAAIFKIFPMAGGLQVGIIQAIHKRWNSGHDIETRASILKYLTTSTALQTHAHEFTGIISQGLDDYTTNARGDVGSLVRIEAVKAAASSWKPSSPELAKSEPFVKLYGKTLRLAAEKLDKVRADAQQAVACVLDSDQFKTCPTSSVVYFRFLLDMQIMQCLAKGFTYQSQWSLEMFEGYVGSADTGSEDLVRASRTALTSYCESGNVDSVCNILFMVCSSRFYCCLEEKLSPVSLMHFRSSSETWPVIEFLFQL
jgi:hypothetical protein